MSSTLNQLYATLLERKQAAPDSSYVATLYAKGLNKILEKVSEESTETLLAAKDMAQSLQAEYRAQVVYETADLWFHTLVMLAYLDIPPNEILTELEGRMGQSGLIEKNNRT